MIDNNNDNYGILSFEILYLVKNSKLFDKLNQIDRLLFLYFKVNNLYYLIWFTNNKKSDLKFIYKIIIIVKVLDKRRRKLRSLKNFFKLASDVRESGKINDVNLNLNLQPLFWQNLKLILQQNRKETLFSFLFEDHTKSVDSHLSELEQPLITLEKGNINYTYNLITDN